MKNLIKITLKRLGLLSVFSRLLYQIKHNGLINGMKFFISEDIKWLLYNHLFDKKLGIETFKNVEVSNLGIDNEKKIDANRYQPVSLRHLEIAFDFLLVQKKNSYDVFIDIGCGKGKPVFYAQKFYPKIYKFIGIDISESMINIANRNKFNLKIDANNIDFIKEDALNYKFDSNKKYLVFMFNPFKKDYFDRFFYINKNLFKKSNFNFVIVNSPSNKISYLDLIYQNKEITLEIYEGR